VTKSSFRRAVLRAHGVDDEGLVSVDQVDAALAALTGALALEGSWTAIGDPLESVILLPVDEVPAGRLPRRPAGVDNSGPVTKAPGRAVAPTEPTGHGQCGCGSPVRRRFRPGHDAKLRAALERSARLGPADAQARLLDLGWTVA
jgi:hypothetical protein